MGGAATEQSADAACNHPAPRTCRHALCVQLYLKLDRVDKAESALKAGPAAARLTADQRAGGHSCASCCIFQLGRHASVEARA